MASLRSPWLGSHRKEPSLSVPPSGLPPLLPPENTSATTEICRRLGFKFWLPLPFEVAAGAAAKRIQRPPLFHFLSSGCVLSVACRF
ncbi:uncharacterized protein DS421_3g95650 [Arachis hypogaea]|nr:uncharacterized protein DS421_3g95650 [Arachis hypogaea]